ncbi:hypothetical protein L207DRAFT_587627 [Hyaloscypha variabilis F]|uniref:Uncharacterized protein n=1 Tax=Hyaloscypha variabilis (strain UAMH 11265 / GT02V1 / F) TaxID=1149755 RepID=A0A2J6R9Y2_HYAVF|nr:hypothetical protein L207DRAFT_587627 [Hyaloscypha variabilis F]
MSSIYKTKSLSGLEVSISDDTSCYSEDGQPRIYFDEYCTFPMGDMCKACKAERAARKKRVSRSDRGQLVEEWVEEINVQKYITNYSGQEFVGGADDRDAIEDEDTQEGNADPDREEEEYADEGDDDGGSDETELPTDLAENNRPDFSGLVPVSFTSEWNTRPNPSSTLEGTSSSTEVASIHSDDSDRDTRLESWVSDIFGRTLDGQMEDTVFIGGAEEDLFQVLCPLCRNPVGDPRDQHLIQCQFAHDEQERMEASLRKPRNRR